MQLALTEPVSPALGSMPHAQGLVYGSVCSGIEAATVAWEPLGWRPAFFAEIEPFPSAVLAHRYPAIPNLGDMTAINGAAWRGKIDVLVGGTPCQAFSVAGLRKSLDDARGNLALKFVELADAINPSYALWENVPGVLSTRDNAFGCLLGGLAGEDGPLLPPGGKWTDAGVVVGPARTVAWRVLDAQYFGLAQRRRRVFVIAGAGDRADPVAVLFERQGLRRDSPPSREAGQGAAGSAACRAYGGNNTSGPIDVATALNACASASGRMDFESETFIATTLQARDLSRGIDSDCTDTLIAHTLRAKANLAHRPDIDTLVTHSLRGESFDASEDGTGRGTPLVPVSIAIPIQEAGARTGISTTDVRAGIGVGSDGDPMFTLQAGKQHAVAFNLRGRDGGAQAEIDADNLASLRAASGGSSRSYVAFAQNQRDEVRPLTVAGALAAEPGTKQQTYVAFDCKASTPAATEAIAPTLRAMDRRERGADNALGRDNAGGQLAVQHGMAVRRLTPTECERLQGFSDQYTRIPWRRKAAEDCPDGPRYRALGNSMAVPVMRWIGRRIQAAGQRP
ncbi:DNA cytosine methyltransferase [Magnetospirillum sp. SS-4]|uniref:DNA cytosine methyltransferase n=1 Tax=Magnetospirillum sp. SS-4 TaxID=2681465 RepID=UPI0013820994|nr:DNA cytosine methyltransferase [Magnetospirillum sp. SS-4]CAA7619732.1 Cytosine-specific methyltransferase [Magnetospirillum sp. SS-4]